MAMIAAFCCALAAMADRNVNTRLKLHPPNNTSPIKGSIFSIGLPRKKVKRRRLSKLITSINMELKSSLASIKSSGPAIE